MHRIYKTLHPLIAGMLRRAGYAIMRDYRVPRSTLNLLDMGLWTLRDRSEIAFLQVGASDQRTHDPLRVAERDDRFRGIMIEPLFDDGDLELRREARLKRMRCVVADRDGECTFYTVESGNSLRARQKSSLSKEHLRHHNIAGDAIKEVRLPVRTVASILSEFGQKRLDLFVCDAEGADWSIARQMFRDGIEPEVLFFEIAHLDRLQKQDMHSQLGGRGYRWCETMTDVLAVR